jgi:hypothetical protein
VRSYKTVQVVTHQTLSIQVSYFAANHYSENLKSCKEKAYNNIIPHCIIVPTAGCSVLLFISFLGAFLGLGLLLFNEAIALNDFEIQYDNVEDCMANKGGKCTVSFTLETSLVNPMVYYRLDEFYANHRSFVKSKDQKQLRGQD